MRTLLLLVLWIVCKASLAQQALTNTGAITVTGGVVSITGNYVQSGETIVAPGSNALVIGGGGLIEISGDFSNYSNEELTSGEGDIVLNGSAVQTIESSAVAASFYNLIIDNASGARLLGRMEITNSLDLQNGSMDLDTGDLMFVYPATLVAENDVQRLFTTADGKITTDAVSYSGGELNNYISIAGLGLEIQNTGFTGGDLSIGRSHQVQNANANNESILRTFRISLLDDDPGSPEYVSSPSAIRFHYLDSELGSISSQENNFALFHSADNGDTWVNRGGIVNAAGNYAELSGIDNVNGLWTVSYCVPPVVSLGDDIALCPQGSSTLTANAGGTAPFTYGWLKNGITISGETGATLDIQVDTDAEQYGVIITDSKGCSAQDEIGVAIHPLPAIDLGADVSVCENAEAVLDAGSGFSSYQWLDPGNVPVGNEQIFSAIEEGTYSVIVTNASGCENSDIINVVHKPVPQSDLPATSSTCGDQAILGSGLADLNPGATFVWRDPQGTITGTQPTLTASEEGAYEVFITGSNGCEMSSVTTVILNSADLVDLGEDKRICASTSIELNAARPNSTYLWSTGETSESISYQAGSTDALVWVEITDLTSICTARDTVMIEVEPLPAPDLGPDKQICENTSTTLDAGAGYTSYRWNDNSSDQTLSVSDAGTYSVTVSNDFGCENSDEIEVGFFDPVQFNFADETVTCGGEIELGIGLETLNPGASFAWSNGAVTPVITVVEEGSYTVTITDVNGCTATAGTTAVLNTTDFVNLGPDISLECRSVTIDAGNPGATYLWSDGSTAQSISVDQPGNYSVTVTNPFGCVDTDEVEVVLLPALDSAFFLSATEAGVNDTLFFIGLTTLATTSILWDFDDSIIEDGNSTFAVHAYASAGEFDPVMTTTFVNECVDSYSKRVTITEIKGEDPGGRIGRENIISEVTVYPNPNNGVFRAAVRLSQNFPVSFSIISMSGAPLIAPFILEDASAYEPEFDIRSVVSGVYILLIHAGDETRQYRVVKSR